jgi:hypothetical protein
MVPLKVHHWIIDFFGVHCRGFLAIYFSSRGTVDHPAPRPDVDLTEDPVRPSELDSQP